MPREPATPAPEPAPPAADIPAAVAKAVQARLARPGGFALTKELAEFYEARTSADRQRDSTLPLALAALGSLAVISIDALNGPVVLHMALPLRLAAASLCLFGALLLRRPLPRAAETAAIILPVLALSLSFMLIAHGSNPRVASRYAMAGLFVGVLGNAVLPLRPWQAVLFAAGSAVLLPAVVLSLPGVIDFKGDIDLTFGAIPPILVGIGLSLRNEAARRRGFVHAIQAELDAEALARTNAELARLSVTDTLTGVANRRRFDAEFDRLWSERAERSLGIALIDVDHFKLFNDAAGHAAGDICLQGIAATLQSCLRGERDTVARYGGEEFAVLIPGAGKIELAAIAERLRAAVARIGIAHPGRPGEVVTISIGAVWCPSLADPQGPVFGSPGEAVRRADRALYAAKEAGRNQVMLGDP